MGLYILDLNRPWINLIKLVDAYLSDYITQVQGVQLFWLRGPH